MDWHKLGSYAAGLVGTRHGTAGRDQKNIRKCVLGDLGATGERCVRLPARLRARGCAPAYIAFFRLYANPLIYVWGVGGNEIG